MPRSASPPIGFWWFCAFSTVSVLAAAIPGLIRWRSNIPRRNSAASPAGLILSAFPAAYIAITLVAMLMFAIFPLAGAESAYAQWGWRIPFVIGALLAGVLVLYYIFMVSESEIWETDVERKREKTPLSDLISGPSGRNLLQVLVMMTGFWLTQNIITIFIPTTLLLHMLKLPKYALTSTLLISYAALFFSYI